MVERHTPARLPQGNSLSRQHPNASGQTYEEGRM